MDLTRSASVVFDPASLVEGTFGPLVASFSRKGPAPAPVKSQSSAKAAASRLLLVPSPMSPVPIRSFRYPQDAEIIGRVTGFAMPIADLRTDASATPSQGLATP